MSKKSIIFICLVLIAVIAHGSHFNPGLRPKKTSLSLDDSCLQIAHSLGLIKLDLRTKEKVFKIFQKIAQDQQIVYKKSNLFKASVYAHARNLYRDYGEDFFEVYTPNE